MGSHPDLWQCYFANFFQYKLRLGSDEAISHKILKAFFEALDKQEPMARVISLHCYSHTYHLNLAKMANILRQLDQLQVSVCLGSLSILYLKSVLLLLLLLLLGCQRKAHLSLMYS